MKRLPPNPTYAVSETVLELARRFQYPDADTFGPAAQPTPGGGAPTVVVAPSDSSDLSKSKADFVAVGDNDQETVNEAIASVGSGEMRVLVTEGALLLSDTVVLPPNCSLVGMGRLGTILSIQTAGITAISMDNNCDIRDLSLFWALGGTSGVGIDAPASNLSIHNVWFQGLDTAITVAASGFSMSHCYMQQVDVAIDGSGGNGIGFGTITGNVIVGGILLEGATDRLTIAGNTLVDSGMFLTNAEMVTIAGNTWYGSHVSGANDMLVVTTSGGITIDGNNLYCVGYNAPEFDTCVAVTVTDNQIINCNMGLAFTATDYAQVVGNVIGANPGSFGFNSGSLGEHGIVLTGDHALIEGNLIVEPGEDVTNTYDGIQIDGDQNVVIGNKITPRTAGNTTRYGINIVGGNDNAVYANFLGDSSLYGTADSVDGGTGTQTTPAAGAIGGQFAF